jgi:hypothetical protein
MKLSVALGALTIDVPLHLRQTHTDPGLAAQNEAPSPQSSTIYAARDAPDSSCGGKLASTLV